MNVANLHGWLISAHIADFPLPLDFRGQMLFVVDLKIGTEFGEENIHASAGRMIVIAPNLFQNDFTGNKLVLMVAKQLQQLRLFTGECAGVLRVDELHVTEIEDEIPKFIYGVFLENGFDIAELMASTQDGAHTQLQLFNAEWLGHEIVASQLEPFDALLPAVVVGQDDNGKMLVVFPDML